ncbi:hypothetical protein ACO11K_003661 [Bacillus cytotoxicus]|uniref:hypothetical protein n=1 Tax=unclassified Bacillus cereus group TaxID=2750818 RepID=UPI001F57A6BF|nr:MULTISPECIES: hypothetical protein [unclassified Bacillus cereus group]
MEKTITVDGKQIRLKCTGATPMRFNAQFGKDYFAEVLKVAVIGKEGFASMDLSLLANLETESLYNIIYIFAKTANPDIPDKLSWLDSFDEFPVFDIFIEIQDMIMATMQSKKKM